MLRSRQNYSTGIKWWWVVPVNCMRMNLTSILRMPYFDTMAEAYQHCKPLIKIRDYYMLNGIECGKRSTLYAFGEVCKMKIRLLGQRCGESSGHNHLTHFINGNYLWWVLCLQLQWNVDMECCNFHSQLTRHLNANIVCITSQGL